MARRATLIKQERENNDTALVLDAGDSLIGDREPAMRTQGATSIDALNQMGYDAIVLGPADLSLGPDLLRQRIGEAQFAVLSADMTDATTGRPIAKPYVIKEVRGQRVAIIGLSGAPSMNGFNAADSFATVEKLMAELRGQAAAVILLSHAAPDVNERIASEIAGITAIIEGGELVRPEPWLSPTTGAPIYHADAPSSGHAGRVMGVGQVTVTAGKLTDQVWNAVSLGPEIPDDPAMAEWVLANY